MSEDENHSSGGEEEESHAVTISAATRSSPLAFSRFLSRSRSSLPLMDESTKQDKNTDQTILLPKDYSPASALIQVETTHTFINKVSHKIYDPKMSLVDNCSNQRQIVASARMKEQQILGCLIVEIFLAEKFRATWRVEKASFENRLEAGLDVIKTSPNALPRCTRNALMLLLRVDAMPKSYNIDFTELNEGIQSDQSPSLLRYPTVTYMGLPPPSAHQILQPLLSGLLYPSSKYLQYLYSVVEMIQEYNHLCRELDVVAQNAEEDSCVERTRIMFLCKINECKVKEIARELEKLLPQAGTASETTLQLIVPYVKQIFEQPISAVLAAWHLFDPIARLAFLMFPLYFGVSVDKRENYTLAILSSLVIA